MAYLINLNYSMRWEYTINAFKINYNGLLPNKTYTGYNYSINTVFVSDQ
jgi:hypothetical protein